MTIQDEKKPVEEKTTQDDIANLCNILTKYFDLNLIQKEIKRSGFHKTYKGKFEKLSKPELCMLIAKFYFNNPDD